LPAWAGRATILEKPVRKSATLRGLVGTVEHVLWDRWGVELEMTLNPVPGAQVSERGAERLLFCVQDRFRPGIG
jgi:hypothetical protein